VDTLEIELANGAGRHPARNVVGGDSFTLSGSEFANAHDPLVLDSLEVIDRVIRASSRKAPAGAATTRRLRPKGRWLAFDGTGVGRSWPILTGERGHYELAAGRDPLAYINVLERMANAGGMLTEQLWDYDVFARG